MTWLSFDHRMEGPTQMARFDAVIMFSCNEVNVASIAETAAKWTSHLMLGGDHVEQVEEVLQEHAVRPRQGGHEAEMARRKVRRRKEDIR